MFTNINEAISYIENRRVKHSVEEFREILRQLNIPMKQENMIHIAGTNGKGSTINYLREILNAHGYIVGTFTSPYLMIHNDRIRIDDKPISDEDLLNEINKFYDVIEKENLSMFEIDTLIMLDYFSHNDLDFRLIECGIGGENDKTNVIDPVISVITNVDNDHSELIGPTLYDIINEKMGIIKPHQIFITSETKGTVLARLQEQCDAKDARMIVVPEYQLSGYPFTFCYRDMKFTLENQAAYQATNARLALTIAKYLIKLDARSTIDAVNNASWGGRFEMLKYNDHKIILDGAHNIPAMEAFVDTVKYYKIKDACIIFSCLKKDQTSGMLDLLKTLNYPIVLTSFNDERLVDLEEFETETIKYIKNYDDAIKSTLLKYETVFVTGSLHFISAVRALILDK